MHIILCRLLSQAIFEVLRAAKYLCFEPLKLNLIKYIVENIHLENALEIYMYNEEYNLNLHELKETFLKFTEDEANTLQLLKSSSFLKLPQHYVVQLVSCDRFVAPEKDILEAVFQWKEQNRRSDEQTSEVARWIRLTRFSIQDIFLRADSTNLFSDVRLLTEVRVLTKPDLSKVQPRGRVRELYHRISMEGMMWTQLDYIQQTGFKTG